MASSITLQATMSWSKAYLEQQPLLVNGMEPALSSANLILQTIMGPPFAWPWNRKALTFTTAVQDTVIPGLSKFGFLEGGTVTPHAGGGKTFEIAVKNLLHIDSNLARAQWCSALLDDGAGNITFRLTPAPDQSYDVTLLYQAKAPLMLSTASSWGPVPDEKAYIYQWGFLAMMSLIGNDSRFNEYNGKFVVGLLGAQGGLSEMERNIFLANWTRVMSQLQSNQLGTAERYKARET